MGLVRPCSLVHSAGTCRDTQGLPLLTQIRPRVGQGRCWKPQEMSEGPPKGAVKRRQTPQPQNVLWDCRHVTAPVGLSGFA